MEFGGLKVLMISSDRNILLPGSAVSERMKEYGELVDSLDIVLLCDASHGLSNKDLSSKVKVYPTNSSLKFFRPYDAARIGKRLVFEKQFVRGKSVITAQDPFECGLAGLKVKNKWRIPLEVQLHTDPFSPYFTGFLNTLRKRIARKVLKHADSLRAVSATVADRIATAYGFDEAKISVLPIYVDMKKIEEGRISFDLHARYGWQFIMLAVARLTPEKNLGMALEVMAKLRAYYPDSGLVIVGDGPELSSLERQVKNLGIGANVAFAGWQEDTASYYRTANLFIQTSRFEGYGLALVEAALSNLPLVSTPVGIAEELQNGKEALICPQGDSEFMFKAIYDLVGNNQLRELLRGNGKRAIESRLMSKEDYLKKLKANWEATAARVQA